MLDPLTSPIRPYTIGSEQVGARLCYFRSGSAELIPAHQDWLRQYFIPEMRKHPYAWIDVYGHASRLGDVNKNKALSVDRVAAVERAIRMSLPSLQINKYYHGDADARDFKVDAKNNDGYHRAVLIRWFGLTKPVPTPLYPEDNTIKPPVWKAPRGCWLITDVNSFGIPIRAVVGGGKVDVKILNDKGESYVLSGYGLSAGVGVDLKGGNAAVEAMANPTRLKKFLTYVKDFSIELGLKIGDVQSLDDRIKESKIVGPNETSGGVMKGAKWEANLTIHQIVESGFFAIGGGEAQVLMGGAEIGFMYFGGVTDLSPIWGYYSSAGLATWKAAAGAALTVYKLTSWKKV